MNVPELRPMGIGDILDVTFRLYRRKFLTFLLIALVVYIPYALLMSVPSLVHFTALTPEANIAGQSAVHFNPLIFTVSMIGIILFAILVIPLCTAALVKNISATYLGEDLSAGKSYSRAAPRLLSLVWAQIVAGIVIAIGYVLLIVPGVIFALWFLLLAPVVVLEGIGGGSALGRSRELMRGNIGKGFLLMLIVGILSWVFGAITGVLVGFIPLEYLPLRTFIQGLIPALWLPIQTAPYILLYYDLRIRKEAFDLQRLAESMGQPEAI